MRRYVMGGRWLELPRPGVPGNHILWANYAIRPGDRVFLCCRVSKCTQRRTGNLKDQEANLRRRMKQLGAIVVGVYRHVCSGWHPSWLGEASVRALAQGARILVAETTCRFIRNAAFHSETNPNVQATETDLEGLDFWTEGMVLVTHQRPHATPTQIRSYQAKRGQWAKGKKGGRPRKKVPGYKKRWHEERLPKFRALLAAGYSARAAAKAVGVSKSTGDRWDDRKSHSAPFLVLRGGQVLSFDP